jgi:endonuclease/exonuclease/phosphatase family metal-dependent hydrolase
LIHVLEARLRGLRRRLSRSEWSLRFLNLKKLPEAEAERGLVLIQIDGLSRTQLEKAIKRGRMPFLAKLLRREGYRLHSIYSGMPSTTAAAQGELFYGVKCCIPAFGFRHRESGQYMKLLIPDCALRVEQALSGMGKGLCEGGSSYSNIYSGGARESHWCASELNATAMLRGANPAGFLAVVLWNLGSVARLLGLLAVEFVLAIYDAVRGAILLRQFRQEFLFVFSRVFACVGLRELITVMSSIDVTRGLPVVHVNFVGYDEQSHRRGPSSQFAHFSLRGIDNCIKRIWTAAHRSSRRDYDVWIYSDHGQEATVGYVQEQRRSLESALADVLGEEVAGLGGVARPNNRSQHHVGHSLEELLLRRTGTRSERDNGRGQTSARIAGGPAGPTFAIAAGPLGHVYLAARPDAPAMESMARRLVDRAGIPMVIVADGPGRALAFTPEGRFALPEQGAEVLGSRHAFPEECARDLVVLAHHVDAGDFVLCGWRPSGQPLSFVSENGAHGGCGAEETHAFGIFPGNAPFPHHGRHFRYSDVREAALRLRGTRSEAMAYHRRKRVGERTLRVMTYNVHGCGGMDGKVSAARIARVIAHYEPDVVALQECYGAGKGDQMRAIAAELKAAYHFPSDLHMEQDDYGNALLSAHPMRLVKQGVLPTLPGGRPIEARGAQWVALEIHGTEIQVVNTHFGLFSLERQRQAEAMMGQEWLGTAIGRSPVILLGDFNAFPSSSAYRILSARLYEAQESAEGHKPRNTFWGSYPVSRIDHIFCSPDLKTLGVEIPRTHLTRLASDHLPLIAELGLAVEAAEEAGAEGARESRADSLQTSER